MERKNESPEWLKKRPITVPVLLLLVTVLCILGVLFYSRLLLVQQADQTERGEQLSERYAAFQAFADKLGRGSELMLQAQKEIDRIKAARLLGEAYAMAEREVARFQTDIAEYAGNGQEADRDKQKPDEQKPEKQETDNRAEQAVQTLFGEQGALGGIGEHEGPLTQREQSVLEIVNNGAAAITEALQAFRPASGEAGYRAMAVGGAWIGAASIALEALEATAEKLRP